MKKQTISLIEREMERFLEQREKIGRKLNRVMKKLDKAMLLESKDTTTTTTSSLLTTTGVSSASTNSDINNTSSTTTKSSSSSSGCFDAASSSASATTNGVVVGATTGGSGVSTKADELREQIDIMKSNIDYLQDQIAECQTNIIQLDEAKDGCDYLHLESLVHTIASVDEAKFILKKFLVLALNKGIAAAQKEHFNNELECELEQIEKDYYVQQQVVQQIINSGQISNEAVQQILLYNQPITTNVTNISSSSSSHQQQNHADGVPTFPDDQQPRELITSHINGSFMMMNGMNDNFEIDEIILAPMIDG